MAFVHRQSLRACLGAGLIWAVSASSCLAASDGGFQVEEASIAGIQSAITAGRTSCKAVVQAYLARAKAYNGVCTALLTKTGKPVPPSTGMIRAGKAIAYPTKTVAASTVFPDLDQYQGPPLELGQMIRSVSDPSVALQAGWRTGIANAGQLNALETVNIRGERSVTCKGNFDLAPSAGPLAADAPVGCEAFRQQPDALEQAAALDARYGKDPDLEKLPMYCAVFSVKNWYDTKDMRSTGGNDVNFAMDVPKHDSPDVALLREKGAIIYAITTAFNVPLAATEGPGPNTAPTVFPQTDLRYAPWSGQACNPYDTARDSRGTSNGSAVSVAANLATCGICEQTVASCKGPASRNNVVSLLTTKGVIGDGGIADRNSGDRLGLHCKFVSDAALTLDALKGFKPEDIFSAIPKRLIPEEPYASFVVPDAEVNRKPLSGVRIGVAREFMVKHAMNDVAISDQIDGEIKRILRDKLGATLVESVDPLYDGDPAVADMTYTFTDAISEILPRTMPEYFWKTDANGALEFAVPGWDVRSPEYVVALSQRQAPLSQKINLRSITKGLANPPTLLAANQYLRARGDARVKNWATWIENAQFKTGEEKARALNSLANRDPRPGSGLSYLQMQSVLRLIILKVMYENKIDVFVNPEQTTPADLLGGPIEAEVNDRGAGSCCQSFTALLGGPEITLPAGYSTIIYPPRYALSADKKRYVSVTGTVAAKLPRPMPVAISFWSGPGSDSDVIKAASAYEAATHHRVPPSDFGPVAGAVQRQRH